MLTIVGESNGVSPQQESPTSESIDNTQLPSDLLVAHTAAVSCIRLAMQLHKAATSDAFDEKADVELLVALEKRLRTARPLILASSKKLSISQLSPKARGWYNGQQIIEDNAHLVALEMASLLYVGCWGAGDPRGLARALARRPSRDYGVGSEGKGIATIDPQVIQGRHKHLRTYLCTIRPLAGERLVKAMEIEVEMAAQKDRETAPAIFTRRAPTTRSNRPNEEKPNDSNLYAASRGVSNLLCQLKTLRKEFPCEWDNETWSRYGRSTLLPELLASPGVSADEGALALVQGKLAEARQGKRVRAANEERETAALVILALWRRLWAACCNSGVNDCYKAALSAIPFVLVQKISKTGSSKDFPWMLKEAARCVLNSYLPHDEYYEHDPAWVAFYENLRISEDFQLAVSRVDSSRLVRELAEILDFEPDMLEAELKLEFRDLLANEKEPGREDEFLDFPAKQRKLLGLLQGEGNVPVRKVTQVLYGRNGSLDTLLKLKKDTNRNLAVKRPGYEIRKQGDTFLLGKI
jgi:hypothetical protein